MAEFNSKIKTIEWVDTYSKMVDQTVIPHEFKYVNITNGEETFARGICRGTVGKS